MPVQWTIDHAQGLVEIVFEGEAGPEDLVRLFDAMEAEKAVPYRKLLDGRRVVAAMDGRAMIPLAQRMTTLKNPGPFAVIVPETGRADGIARLFLLLAEATQRGRVFRNADEARQWLLAWSPPSPTEA